MVFLIHTSLYMSVRNKERFCWVKVLFFQKLNCCCCFFPLVVGNLYISKLTWKVTSHMKCNFCNHWCSASCICSRYFLNRPVSTSAEQDSEIALELASWEEKTMKWLWLASEILDDHLTFRRQMSTIVDVPQCYPPKLHFIYSFNKYRYRLFSLLSLLYRAKWLRCKITTTNCLH